MRIAQAWVILALCSFAWACRLFAAEPPTNGFIVVDADHPIGQVNPLIFGQNIEAGDTADIFGRKTDLAMIRTGNGFWDPQRKRLVPAILDRCREINVGLLRYPGGCLAHNFDWRRAVGPASTRGDWTFGLPEFLTCCRQIGAIPMVTVSDYVLPTAMMPEFAAQLVEYLNAPATAEHPWAMRRKEDGHPEPYGVVWFELGNESAHGNHQMQPHRNFSPEEYGRYAAATAQAMKRIDPNIRIGINSSARDSWNRTVLSLAGKYADFFIVHLYAPGPGTLGRSNAITPTAERELMQACMAMGDQIEHHLDDYHRVIREACGRDLPLAVTEFNAGFKSDLPKPYRFSYGAALECADLLRIFMKPSSGVCAAAYWALLNDSFAMIQSDLRRSDGGIVRERPSFQLFRLWGQHFRGKLVNVDVQAPSMFFRPSVASRIDPSKGSVYTDGTPLGSADFGAGIISRRFAGPGYDGSVSPDGTVTVDFEGYKGDAARGISRIFRPPEAARGCEYHLSFQTRFLPGIGTDGSVVMGMGMGDMRGSNVSACCNIGRDWQPLGCDLAWPLSADPDSPGIQVAAYLQSWGREISGRLEFKNITIEESLPPGFPQYALITASASVTDDGKTLCLIVFNKSDSKNIEIEIRIRGFSARRARRWTVDAPDLAAFDGIREVASSPDMMPMAAERCAFPAHSMTAIEFYRD